MPEVTMVKPLNGKHERTALNFGLTLVNDSNVKSLIFRNIGVIPAKVIIEVYEDPKFFFAFDTHDYEENMTNGQDWGAEWR